MRLSTLTPEEVMAHSVRVVNLLDLAGDEKYLKTTGMTARTRCVLLLLPCSLCWLCMCVFQCWG